jgi:hypothetical protein
LLRFICPIAQFKTQPGISGATFILNLVLSFTSASSNDKQFAERVCEREKQSLEAAAALHFKTTKETGRSMQQKCMKSRPRCGTYVIVVLGEVLQRPGHAEGQASACGVEADIRKISL